MFLLLLVAVTMEGVKEYECHNLKGYGLDCVIVPLLALIELQLNVPSRSIVAYVELLKQLHCIPNWQRASTRTWQSTILLV